MSDLRRGIYILPNLFTLASLLCGFFAIVHAFNLSMNGRDDFWKCAIAILFAALFDMMDGRVARHTRTSSKFGSEFDSIVDVVSFGVAPAFVMYVWGLNEYGRLGWGAAFVFLACGAIRLARFNVQSSDVEKNFFQGLPIPMAALMMVGSILIYEGRPTDNMPHLLILTALLGFLMVSNIRYRSFKSLNLAGRHPFYYLVAAVAAVVVGLTEPWWVLYAAGSIFVLSGPAERFVLPAPVRAFKKARGRRRVRKSLDKIDEITSSPATPMDENLDNVSPLRKL